MQDIVADGLNAATAVPVMANKRIGEGSSNEGVEKVIFSISKDVGLVMEDGVGGALDRMYKRYQWQLTSLGCCGTVVSNAKECSRRLASSSQG